MPVILHVLLQGAAIPEDLPRTTAVDKVNCALAEVAADEDEEEDEEMVLVLIATREIKEGELLFVQVKNCNNSDEEEEHDNVKGEYNADETVDPRAVASQDFA